ncbi:MAG: hypothetical protein ABEJ22_09210 [Haloferacaceae archaeon]
MSPHLPSARRRLWVVAALWGAAAYVFHAIGNANGLYLQYWWFQIVAHVWSATALAGLLSVAGLTVELRGRHLVAFVVVSTTAGALGWELVEYLGVFPNLLFHGLGDSLLDLTADAVGLGAVLRLLGRRESVGRGSRRTPDPSANAPREPHRRRRRRAGGRRRHRQPERAD